MFNHEKSKYRFIPRLREGHGEKTDSQRMYVAKPHTFADYSALSFSVSSVNSVVKNGFFVLILANNKQLRRNVSWLKQSTNRVLR